MSLHVHFIAFMEWDDGTGSRPAVWCYDLVQSYSFVRLNQFSPGAEVRGFLGGSEGSKEE